MYLCLCETEWSMTTTNTTPCRRWVCLTAVHTSSHTHMHSFFLICTSAPQISKWMAQIQEQYSDVVETVHYGFTYEHRTISLLKVSQSVSQPECWHSLCFCAVDLFESVFQIGLPSEEKKKAIWMDCGIHAREWIAPAFCQYFVKQVRDMSLHLN